MTIRHPILLLLNYIIQKDSRLSFSIGNKYKKNYYKYYNWPQKKIKLTFPSRYKNFDKKDFKNKMFLPYDFVKEDEILKKFRKFFKKIEKIIH